MSKSIKSKMKRDRLTLVDLIDALSSFNFENIYIYDMCCRPNRIPGLVRSTSFVYRAEQDGLKLLRAPSNDMRDHGDLFFKLDEKDQQNKLYWCDKPIHDTDPRLATIFCPNCGHYLCDSCNILQHKGANPLCLGLSVIMYLGSKKRNHKSKPNTKSKKNKKIKRKGSLNKNRKNKK